MYESEIYNLIRIKLVKLIDIRIHIVILYYIKIDKKKKIQELIGLLILYNLIIPEVLHSIRHWSCKTRDLGSFLSVKLM